ncbi:AAA family ATPase, partial [Nonomuraea sp. SBT364]|uniref:AAA family ATPase n=1 Tax=Nonomuraea sp. SBT364 TaxID=1580530 RepID=UPI0012E13DD2
MLYGRAAETAAIDELIGSTLAGDGRALVLRGVAGVGKSALLDQAASRAGDATVLRAGGVEGEADLAYAALHQLVWPVIGLLDALPGPQRDAVAGAFGMAAPSEDRFLVSAGVLSLLVEAAAEGGLVCLVDDFQWVDRASADALLFAARRLRTERVGMVLAVRGDAAVKGLPELPVGGLDADSADALLDARAVVAPGVRSRLVSLTGGNPLVLGEAVAVLTADQLAGRAPLPDPLPGGEQLFGDQVARLSAAARRVLLVAALESDLSLILNAAEALATPVAEDRGAHARAAHEAGLHEAEAAGLVVASGGVVRFRHPLVRSAVHAAAGPAESRRAHGVLAGLVDADRRAWHLAAAAVGRDESVAGALAAAAARAQARGGYGDAATALARAAELTPESLTRALRYKEAAEAAWLGGRPGQAQTYLAEARTLAEAHAPTEESLLPTTPTESDTPRASEAPRPPEARHPPAGPRASEGRLTSGGSRGAEGPHLPQGPGAAEGPRVPEGAWTPEGGAGGGLVWLL